MVRARPWQIALLLAALGSVFVTGCASLQQTTVPEAVPLPRKREMRVGPFVVISDLDLKREQKPFKDLEGLQDQVCKELRLPATSQVVYVYIFNDRTRYDQYMQANFRYLPSRRAFFMARTDERRGDEMVVYTYWGDRIEEDLRHELTHALLHSSLKNVPMWLDEGLAEYFEVPPNWHGVNYRHLTALRSQPGIPWSPDLARLEKITLVKDMSPADYRESWAWVHLMLRGDPRARTALLNYLQQLRTAKDPGLLEPQLAAVFSDPEATLRQHLARLEQNNRNMPPSP